MSDINESNAGRIRALMDILNESATDEEIVEAADFDQGDEEEEDKSHGEKYGHDASMPGKAAAHVRYTPARQSDNPMVEDVSLEKSFLDYLKEAEEKTSSDEDASEN
jgi:hypothetical protein